MYNEILEQPKFAHRIRLIADGEVGAVTAVQIAEISKR